MLECFRTGRSHITSSINRTVRRYRFRPRLEAPADRLVPTVTPTWAVGAAPGGEPWVWVYNSDGTQANAFLAFESDFTGGVRTAMADLNGDGTEDVVAAAGPGGGPRVRVFDGATGDTLSDFMAYESDFTGGVWVAAGPVGSGQVGIATGADATGGPRVKVFAEDGTTLQDLFAFDSSFQGGVLVALGQTSGGPTVYAAPGDGLDPRVRGFDIATGIQGLDREAGPAGTSGGTLVATGDMDADGMDDVFTAVTVAGGTELRAFSGATGMLMHEGQLEGWADGLAVVNWNGQRAVGVEANGSLRVYSLTSGTQADLLGEQDLSQLGDSGLSIGGNPSGGAAGDLGAGAQQIMVAAWPFNTGNPSESVTVTSKVTMGLPDYPDTYKWEYFVHNNDFDAAANPEYGVGVFDLSVPAPEGIIETGTDMAGWEGHIESLPGSEGTLFWHAPDPTDAPQIMPGEDGSFWFTTPAMAIEEWAGEAYDPWYAGACAGAALVPDVQIKFVTWAEKSGETGGKLDDQPKGTPGGGRRIFAERKKYDTTVAADEVYVVAQLSAPKGGVTINFDMYDVDDPSANEETPEVKVVDDESKATDNRGAAPGLGTFSAVTDADGVAVVTRRVSRQPGDNFRVAASVDDIDLTKDVVVKQKDGDRAGLYFAQGGVLPTVNAKTVMSPLLTVWRHLFLEMDQMKVDAGSTERFDGAGVGNDDVYPDGGDGWVRKPSWTITRDVYAAAYIDVLLVPDAENTHKQVKFTHNLSADAATQGTDAKAARDFDTNADRWYIQVVAAYEGPEDSDWDGDDTSATLGRMATPVYIYMETIRDYAATSGDARTKPQVVLEDRVLLHETLHKFSLPHNDPNLPAGDEGPLVPGNNLYRNYDDNKLTPRQLDHVRRQLNPNYDLSQG